LWSEAEADGSGFGDRSSPLAAEAFTAWLREPAPRGAAAGLNRYLYAVYGMRPDLQAAFPDLDADASGLIVWGWEQGRQELNLNPDLLPPADAGLAGADDGHLTVNVVGYLRDTLGIGEAARRYIAALDAANVPVTTTAVSPDLPVAGSKVKPIERLGHRAGEERQAPYEPVFNLVCMNGDHLAAFVRAGGGELLADAITVGHWAWETDVLPPSWLPGFEQVDEIWVISNFIAERLGRLSPVPVVTVPMGITVPATGGADAELITDDRFTFLFLFDFFSTLQRKNPLGLIEAFKRAFAPGEGPRLLLKTMNEKFRPEAAEEVRARIGGRTDIELVDRYLEPEQTASLLARANCYVSLHRSEGFGLTLAESMLLGTPVVTTAYSGNMDFTTERNSYLVDWTPTRVGPDCEVYPPEGSWAEPDVDHAAQLMRRAWESPDEAAEKAARARIDIERQYAPEVAGAVARGRLETLLELRRTGPRRDHTGALRTIERELTLDLRRGRPSQRRAAAAVRRLAMRMMLPFTLHERNLDRAVLDALREIRVDLARERARGARTGARLRRLEEQLTRAREPTS
jgi:glycosyltransferase involved in cell wall biosynthesis